MVKYENYKLIDLAEDPAYAKQIIPIYVMNSAEISDYHYQEDRYGNGGRIDQSTRIGIPIEAFSRKVKLTPTHPIMTKISLNSPERARKIIETVNFLKRAMYIDHMNIDLTRYSRNNGLSF